MAKEPTIKEDKIEYIEFVPDIIPVSTNNYQNEFLYGKSIEALDYDKQLKNIPTGGNFFAGTVTYTTTGTKTVTGVGFTPIMIKISSSLATGAISDGVYFGGSVNCRYYFTGGGAADASGQIGYSAYLGNGGNASILTTITPTSDGFTIVVNNVSGGAISIIYECYG